MFIESGQGLAQHAAAADVTIVGSGPLGLIAGLDLARKGRSVLILESGTRNHAAEPQDLADAELVTPLTHYTPEITTERRLGGGGHLWGGRCVPFDPIDFAKRPWLNLAAWPIGADALEPYLAQACEMLGAGQPVFTRKVPDCTPNEANITLNRLERWSNQPRLDTLHAAEINDLPNLKIALGCTVTRLFANADNQVSAVGINGAAPDKKIPVRQLILAAGGNATASILLNEQTRDTTLFGGQDGSLGRTYMGHVNGQIADIVVQDSALHNALDFFLDGNGSYARHRLAPSDAAQQKHRLPNLVFWPVVPPIREPAHKSGALSALFLALANRTIGRLVIAEPIRQKHVGAPPYRRMQHIANLLRDPVSLVRFLPVFIWRRYMAKNRVPGFFLTNPGKRYGLEFHAEHLPDPDSRLTLSERRDAVGQQRLKIDFRFSEEDAEGVIRAHHLLDDWLRSERLGHLIYRSDDLRAAVHAEAMHGNHQIGTVRMGHSAADGVVDQWGTSFDFANLHVASTAVFPTSSQATPTLAGAQFTLRLTDHLIQHRQV